MDDTLYGLLKLLKNLQCRRRLVCRAHRPVRYLRARRDFDDVCLIGIQTYMVAQSHGRLWIIIPEQMTVRVNLVWRWDKIALLPVELSDEDAVRLTLLTAHLL